MSMNYKKANKYTDMKTIYQECSGPGGLQLAEYMAEKMKIEKDKKKRNKPYWRLALL